MDLIAGELVALVQVDDGGQWRMAAVLATERGPLVGVLAQPAGRAGRVVFEPIPALKEALGGHEALEQASALQRPDEGVDPDDPRGLRAGGRTRAPGMR